MKNKERLSVILLFLISVLAGPTAWADIYDTPEVTPIAGQLHPSGSELNLKTSYFPIGAFNKYIGFGGSYLNMYGPVHGWEVLTGYYFVESPSGLKGAVISSFGAQESDFAVLKYLFKTGYTYVPFYSKSILFNSSLIHSRTYLNISAGMADYQIEKPALISAGYGQNFYFGRNYGLKLEVDYMHFFKQNSYIQDQLTLSAGLVISWGDNAQ